MSFEAENTEHDRSLLDQNDRIIKLLAAILIGIEIISNQEDLLDQVED